MGIGALIALGIGAGVGAGVSALASGGGKGDSKPMDLPQPPKLDDASEKAAQSAKRKRAARTKTIYTSPLGIGGEADVTRKTLLGQ